MSGGNGPAPHDYAADFRADPSMQNAIRLAIADHRAQDVIDWEYIHMLNAAIARLDSVQRHEQALRTAQALIEAALK